MPARITVFTTLRCPHCRDVKQYLDQRGLSYRELRVDRDRQAAKALARLGARGVPVVMIGETRVDGFDRRRLDRLLGKNKP